MVRREKKKNILRVLAGRLLERGGETRRRIKQKSSVGGGGQLNPARSIVEKTSLTGGRGGKNKRGGIWGKKRLKTT